MRGIRIMTMQELIEYTNDLRKGGLLSRFRYDGRELILYFWVETTDISVALIIKDTLLQTIPVNIGIRFYMEFDGKEVKI